MRTHPTPSTPTPGSHLKNSPQIALNHNGTVFKDASNYVWKVGFAT